MTADLPRVTYATSGSDFEPLHQYLDDQIPKFREAWLGRHFSNFINNQADEEGEVYSSYTPIDNTTLLSTSVAANEQAVGRAVAAAKAAWPEWSATPWQERVQKLRAWLEVLKGRKFELAIACLIEIGKSRIEAMGEMDEILDMVEYYCNEVERHQGYEQPLNRAFPQEETGTRLRPIGVFGVIAPFNFPLALSVNMITGALLGGNTVVFKPSPHCAITAHILVQSLADIGLGHIINLVAGHDECGKAIVAHPDIAGIAFTGSHSAGMAIFRQLSSSRYAKPLVAEMGGKNPAYVCASADIKTAARGVARSAFGLQGQKCSACSVAYVHSSIKDAFLEELKAVAGSMVIGDPQARETFMGPIYNSASAERFLSAVALARQDGQVLFGGEQIQVEGQEGGLYLRPAIVEVPKGHSLLKDELFAPFVAIRAVDSLEEALIEGNDVLYGLAAGVYTSKESELDYFLENAEAGALYANRASGATTGAWPGIQSFCGWKGSGVSHKGGLGPNYLQQFMREQSRTLMRG